MNEFYKIKKCIKTSLKYFILIILIENIIKPNMHF